MGECESVHGPEAELILANKRIEQLESEINRLARESKNTVSYQVLESALRSLVEEYPFSDYPTPALDHARSILSPEKESGEQDSPNDWPDP